MAHPLMPKATAVWLVDNTVLTFDQIAALCDLHPLEVQGIADGEVAIGIVGRDPMANGDLTREEIERCEKDAAQRLTMSEPEIPLQPVRKGPRYTPVSKRQSRPDAISWLVKYHPELTDSQVCKLVGTTKPTVNAVRDRTHWNTPNLKPEDPVTLGMCNQTELDQAISAAVERLRRKEERDLKAAAKAKREKQAAAAAEAAARGEPAVVIADAAAVESAADSATDLESPPDPVSAEPTPPVATILKPRVDKEAASAKEDLTVEGVFGSAPAGDDDASGEQAVPKDPFKPN